MRLYRSVCQILFGVLLLSALSGLTPGPSDADPSNAAPLAINPGHNPQAAGLRDKARDLLAKFDYSDAILLYQQAYALDKALFQSDATLDLYKIASCYYKTSHYKDALTYYQLELSLEQKIGDKVSVPVTLNNIGLVYNELSQYTSALDCYRAVLLLQHSGGDTVGTAATLSNIGSVYDDLSQHGKAMEIFQKALLIQQRLADKPGEAQTLSNIGEDYEQAGQYAKAADCFAQSLHLSFQLKDKIGVATGLANLGLVYKQQGQYATALQCYQYAAPLLHLIGNRDGEAVTLNNIAAVYDDLGQPAKALDSYLQVLVVLKQVGDKAEIASALVNTGMAYDDLGEHSKALDYYQQALPIQKKIGDEADEATTLTNIGVVYSYAGDYQQALHYMLEALPIRRKYEEVADEGKTLNDIGSVYEKMARYDLSLQYYEDALTISRSIGDKPSEAIALGDIMKVASSEGNLSVAIFFGKQAVDKFQSIRANLAGLDKSSQSSYLKSNQAYYRTLSDLLIRKGRLPEAQQVLGLLKEQEVFDFLRGQSTETPDMVSLTPAEASQEDAYNQIADQVTALGESQQDILDKIRQGSATQEDRTKLDDVKGKLIIATHHLNSFIAHLAEAFSSSTPEASSLESRLQAVKNASGLQDMLRQLHVHGEDVVVLETIVAPDRYAVIVTTAQSQKVEQYSISQEDLNKKVADFQNALRDPTVDPRPAALALYKIVFAPIENDLKQADAKTLMWSLDSTLRYVPIAALYDGKQYLVERFDNEVFTLGSLSGFGTDETTSWEGLGLGVSQAHSYTDPVSNQTYNFPALRAVPAELNAVIDSTANKEGIVPGEILLDPQFTQATMTQALEQQKYNIVHIASHFSLHPGDPNGSFLLLGDGNHLSLANMADDQTLFQGVDLLALSACDTATGGTSSDGAEVDSLGTIAQQDGAKSVLASLWPVSDDSTRMLMQGFYRIHERTPGTSKADALRQAQLSLLDGTAKGPAETNRGVILTTPKSTPNLPAFTRNADAPYAHPFYWAPFILIGNWR